MANSFQITYFASLYITNLTIKRHKLSSLLVSLVFHTQKMLFYSKQTLSTSEKCMWQDDYKNSTIGGLIVKTSTIYDAKHHIK